MPPLLPPQSEANGSDDLHSGWNLSTLDVLDKSSGMKSSFNHNAWVTQVGGGHTWSHLILILVTRDHTGGWQSHLVAPDPDSMPQLVTPGRS